MSSSQLRTDANKFAILSECQKKSVNPLQSSSKVKNQVLQKNGHTITVERLDDHSPVGSFGNRKFSDGQFELNVS